MKITQSIIGIDPGTSQTAVTELTVRCGVITRVNAMKIDNPEFLAKTRSLASYEVDHVFIEGMQSYGMPVGKETFETCYLIGRVLEILEGKGIGCTMLFRKDIVQHHCLTTKGKDAHVRAALIERLGAPGTKKNPGLLYGVTSDMWSSTAIAVMGVDKIVARG